MQVSNVCLMRQTHLDLQESKPNQTNAPKTQQLAYGQRMANWKPVKFPKQGHYRKVEIQVAVSTCTCFLLLRSSSPKGSCPRQSTPSGHCHARCEPARLTSLDLLLALIMPQAAHIHAFIFRLVWVRHMQLKAA